MKNMKIGNWEVSEQGIDWRGGHPQTYRIERASLNERGPGDRSDKYDWLVHLTEKTWISREDMYALNTALVYAIGILNLDFDVQVFANSVIEQDELLRQAGK